MFKRLLFIFSLFLPLAAAFALDLNGVKMTASVNKTSLTMEDELTLTVTVEGAAGDITPQLPSLPAFNVYGRSVAKQIINFHSTTTFEYIMVPRFPGKTVIGPVTLYYGNKTYETQPISVTVYRTGPSGPNASARTAQTSARPAASARKTQPLQEAPLPADMPPLERDLYNMAARHGNEDFFMVAAVSDKTPYVNQPVILGVRFYFSRSFMDNAPYSEPAISNLFMEQLSNSEGRQTIGGKSYGYIERRYALSGVTEGKATAGGASVRYIPTSGSANLSVFDRMFASVSQEPQTATSNTVTLNVRPTPAADKPKSFYGAVGTGYTISATVDRQQVEAGEAVNLTVKVNGPGNLKPTSDLKLPALPGFKVYDVVSTSGSVPSNGELKSYKIFKTVIVPVSSGTYTIPALSWSYFDPKAKEYRTIRTQPITITVTPSSKADTGFDFGARADLGGGFRQLGQDIRYLKSAPAGYEKNILSALSNLDWISYIFIALLVAAGIFALTDKQTLAGKRALAKARSELKNARTEEAVSEAMTLYLQTRYGVRTGSLPLAGITQALKKRGCPDTLIKRFETLWQRLNAARFAPVDLQGEGTAELARLAAELMKDMDKGGRV